MIMPSGLMCERRPAELAKIIEADFEEVVERDAACISGSSFRRGDGWEYRGLDSDYVFTVLSPFGLLTWLNSRNGTKVVARGHVLDVGACLGFTVEKIKDEAGFQRATGITAKKTTVVDSVVMTEGNICSPEVYSGVEPADLLVSRFTLLHVADQLSVLEIMANALTVDGHMIVQFDANSDDLLRDPDLVKTMENSGLKILGIDEEDYIFWGGLVSMHATRKSDEPILFNVGYDNEGYVLP